MTYQKENLTVVLNRFMGRMHRVMEHSMVRDDSFKRYVEGVVDIKLNNDGLSLYPHLPPNMEIFESLAIRIRPVALQTESIYLTKVTKAIEKMMQNQDVGEDCLKEFDALNDGVKSILNRKSDFNLSANFYSLRENDSDSMESIPLMVIAECWMYGDLAHVDVRDDKKKALSLPFNMRYFFATSYYCSLVGISLAVARYVEKLVGEGIVGDSRWGEC